MNLLSRCIFSANVPKSSMEFSYKCHLRFKGFLPSRFVSEKKKLTRPLRSLLFSYAEIFQQKV